MDMKFLENQGISGRGPEILASRVRMAKKLGMHTIAEGIETKEQGDFQACKEYGQGWLLCKTYACRCIYQSADGKRKCKGLMAMKEHPEKTGKLLGVLGTCCLIFSYSGLPNFLGCTAEKAHEGGDTLIGKPISPPTRRIRKGSSTGKYRIF